MNPNIAYKLDQIDPNLDANRDEGESRLAPLRGLLRSVASRTGNPNLVNSGNPKSLGALLLGKKSSADPAKVMESFLSATAETKAKTCLVARASRILTIEEADDLQEEQRVKCIPVQSTASLAMADDEADYTSPHVLLRIPKELCGASREAKMDIERIDQQSVGVMVISPTGTRKYIKACGIPIPLLDKLFSNGAAQRAPRLPIKKNDAPEYIKAAIVDFLERRVRLQVLCTAATAAPVTRPVAVDSAHLKEFNPQNKCWLSLSATLHPSSSTCICKAHGMHFDWGGSVEVKMETCGRWLVDVAGKKRCPCHDTALNANGDARFQLQGFCTEATRVTVACLHRSGQACKRGIYVDYIALTDADRREVSEILVNMAEFEARTADLYEKGWARDLDTLGRYVVPCEAKLKQRLESVQRLQLAEQNPKYTNARELLQRDMVAVDLLRGGGVFRHTVKRGDRRGAPYIKRTKRSEDTNPLESHETALEDTHAHLFRKSVL